MSKLKMVNLSDELIDQYCTKYKLTRARYDEEKALLEQKKNQEGQQAYSEEQINRLILKVSSKKTVSSVLSLHAELIGEGLTPVDIFKIAAHGGGSKNLLAYIEQTEALREQGLSWQGLGLEVADVVRLLSHHGGSKKLKALMYLMALPHEQKQSFEEYFGLTEVKVFQLLLQSGGVKQFFQLIADYHVIEDALLSWKGGEVEGLFSSEESDYEEVTGLEKQGHVNACDSFDFNESVACNMNYERDDIRVRKKHGFFSASDNARDEDERNDEVYVPSKKHRSI